MNKNLIKKEYVIQANNQKGKDDWYDYIRSDKKSSALKTLKKLNTSDPDGKYRLIVYKVFGKQVDIKKETAKATPKTITFGKWKKPLTWTVIDEDDENMLLMCDTCVECMRFDGNSNTYAFSEIRSWLNNKDDTYNTSKEDYTNIGFLNAFTENEKLMCFSPYGYDYVGILSNEKRMCFSPYGYDYVGLLSVDEYKKYKEKIPKIDDYWWLRSPGFSTLIAAIVDYDGDVSSDGNYVSIDFIGVRPALWLKKDWLKKE